MTEKTKRKDVFSLKRSLANLRTLTVMQLKEKMDVSFLRSFKKTLFRVVFFVLEFVVIAAICFFLFYLSKMLKLFDVIGGRIPTNILTTVLVVMIGLSVIFTTIGLVQSLYLSRDNLVLLTFPARPTMVFCSKLLVYYVYELKKNFMFLIPFFCGYGLALGYPIYYYLWVVCLFAFVATVPVLLGALLSMPVLFVYQFLKKYSFLKYIASILLYTGVFWLVLEFLGALPTEINFLKSGLPTKEINAFADAITAAVPPLAWLTTLLVGAPYTIVPGTVAFAPSVFTSSTLPIFAGFIGALIVLLTLAMLLARPLFYKMASKPFEHAKKMKIKAKSNTKTPVFLSAVKKEWLVAFRDGSVVSMITQFIVIMPLALVILNRLYGAMHIDLIGLQMTVVFNFLIVLLFILSANIRLSSAYSKEGFAARLNKVQPSASGARLLFPKLTVNMVFGLLGTIIGTVVYSYFYTTGTVNLWMFGATSYFIFLAHLFWSAEMDLMNPQYDQYATFSEQSNNPNENKSALLTFILAFAFAIVVFLLMGEGVNKIWIKTTIVSAIIAAFKIFTFFLKIKVYYKEK